ncbi:hypothetical protein [Sphingomonas yantingensis]|uniref:Uncharacterized protein n=1 Tax=Sphingomonas yantingensis TaxID=1241761 RepID=A0A7W9EGU5_9SPHN|nr:hypothetical protein [Sphingomonas yantingensis]MBB5697483.1 hypothetical protein [Sphingomonas yantingensis]
MTPDFWTPTVRRWSAVGFFAAWFASLGLPAAYLANGDAPRGLLLLMIGWISVLMLQPAWLGNLLIWIVLPIVGSSERPWKVTLRLCGGALIICAVGALFWSDLPDDSGSNLIVRYGAGYYLWMIAVLGSGIAALMTASVETDTL